MILLDLQSTILVFAFELSIFNTITLIIQWSTYTNNKDIITSLLAISRIRQISPAAIHSAMVLSLLCDSFALD
jgi:hypothetical protein